jgi:hypothetical protein
MSVRDEDSFPRCRCAGASFLHSSRARPDRKRSDLFRRLHPPKPLRPRRQHLIFNDRVLNAPDWLKTKRYDIEARIDDADAGDWKDPAKRKQMLRVRMQSLLADRCKLVVHREMKDKSAYALVVAKNGPKLQPAESTDPGAIRAKHPDAMAITGLGGMFGPGQAPGDHVIYGASWIHWQSFSLPTPEGR